MKDMTEDEIREEAKDQDIELPQCEPEEKPQFDKQEYLGEDIPSLPNQQPGGARSLHAGFPPAQHLSIGSDPGIHLTRKISELENEILELKMLYLDLKPRLPPTAHDGYELINIKIDDRVFLMKAASDLNNVLDMIRKKYNI